MQVELELIPVSAGTHVHAFDQLTGTLFIKCDVSWCQKCKKWLHSTASGACSLCYFVRVYLHNM